MSEERRRGAATATLGYGGLVGAGALRHTALERAYGGGKRPPLAQEVKLLRRGAKGRRLYLAGAALAVPSGTAAAAGTSRTLFGKADERRRSFLAEGLAGTKEALTQRSANLAEKPPPKLVVGNYALGGAIGSGAGALTNLALRRRRVPGALKAGLAAATGVAAGSTSLPLQSKAIQRASRGKYEATATGLVRHRKPKPQVAKREDIGGSLTRGQRRARITAAGSAPVVGDFASAAMAARLSPERYRRRSAAQTYGGSTAGGIAGNLAGAAGAVALARKVPAVGRGAKAVAGASERVSGLARRAVGLKPKTGPSLTTRVLAHERTPGGVKRLAQTGPVRAVRANPQVAAGGALAGGALGGTAGQQLTYSHILSRDDRYRSRENQAGGHGSRIRKADVAPKPLTHREKKTLASRKEHSAALSAIGGTTGLTALGTTLASAPKSPLKAAHKVRIGRVTVPLLTAGAGLGGANALLGARIQRKEAQQTVAKALVPTGIVKPRLPGRAPGMRRGFIRQTRMPSGLTRVSTVRGGLS